MKKVWIVVKTNVYGEVLELEVYASQYDAQKALEDDYNKEVARAKEDDTLEDTYIYYTPGEAWVDFGDNEEYYWEMFYRELTPERGF